MTLKLTLEGDRRVIVTRRFKASPDRVFAAHTEPALIRRWMLGPDGWEMTDCIMEPRVGGHIRHAWAPVGGGAGAFHLTGEVLEIGPGHRIVHVERMFLPDPTPDNRIETVFADDGAGGTLMRMEMTLPDGATRDMMLSTGMEHGMEASYARLEGLI